MKTLLPVLTAIALCIMAFSSCGDDPEPPALTYTIGASPTTLNFGSLQAGYAQPAAQTVTITNTGTGSVTLTQPTSTDFIIGTLSKTVLAAEATATFTVRPKSGLAANAYSETIAIEGTNNAKATVTANFTVTAEPPETEIDFETEEEEEW